MNYPQGKPHSCSLSVFSLGGSGGRAALPVSVLYLSCQVSERAHPSGALASSALRLDGPVVAANLARGVARRGASLLLPVPVLLATVATERVRLVAAFSLSLSSLRLPSHETSAVSTRQHICLHAWPAGLFGRDLVMRALDQISIKNLPLYH